MAGEGRQAVPSGVVGQDRLDPWSVVEPANDRLVADGRGCHSHDVGGLVDQLVIAAKGDAVAAQRLCDLGRAGLAAPARQRPAVGDVLIQQGLQQDGQLPIGVLLAGRRLVGPPGAVRGEDVGGELVDEPHRPGEQRSKHVLRDAGGGVLPAALSRGLAPPVEVRGVETQGVRRQRLAPEPEPAGPRADRLPGASRRQRGDQEALEVLKIGSGQGVQAPRPAVHPAQEPHILGEDGADGPDGGPVLAWGQWPGQHGKAEFLGDLPVAGGDAGEVQDEPAFVLLEHGWGQVPDVVAEACSVLKGPAQPQAAAAEDERIRSVGQNRPRRGAGVQSGRQRHRCSHGFSIRSSRASVGLSACACCSSAGVNLVRMSWRIAAHAGP